LPGDVLSIEGLGVGFMATTGALNPLRVRSLTSEPFLNFSLGFQLGEH